MRRLLIFYVVSVDHLSAISVPAIGLLTFHHDPSLGLFWREWHRGNDTVMLPVAQICLVRPSLRCTSVEPNEHSLMKKWIQEICMIIQEFTLSNFYLIF